MGSGDEGVKDDAVVKLGRFKKVVEAEQREVKRRDERAFFDELINLLDILELKCQQDTKWLYPEAGEIMEGVA